MPVLPHASLSQFRPSCGSGSGLRGVLPGAASWSRGSRRCAAGEPSERLFQAYLYSGALSGGMASFSIIDGVTETASFDAPTVVARTWAAIGYSPTPLALAADDVGDVPVLLVEIPDGDGPEDMPLTQDVPFASTPVFGAFVLNAAHTTEFGSPVYLLDPGEVAVTRTLSEVSLTQKSSVVVDCGLYASYVNEGGDAPAPHWCFGREDAVTEGTFRVKQVTIDAYHIDFRSALRVSDSQKIPFHIPVFAEAAGDYVMDDPTLSLVNPAIGSVAALGDTPCP